MVPQVKTAKPTVEERLGINIVVSENEKPVHLARELVEPGDLVLARDETWWTGVRKDLLPLELRSLQMRASLAGKNGKSGFRIELTGDSGSFAQDFPLRSLAHVADRGSKRLLDSGDLKPNDFYHYYLCAEPKDGETANGFAPETSRGLQGRVQVRTRALQLIEGRLADYLARSRPISGPTSEVEANDSEPSPMPVFITGELWELAHQRARRGGEKESGGVFTGRLMRDTASPEVFLVIEECLEASHAEEKEKSVYFTGETWAELSRRLEQRRRRLGRPEEIIVGSVHGHNFAPEANAEGVKMCEACATRAVCSRTTAVLSTDDQSWHTSVFAGQPWSVLLIWGWNARDEEDWRLYGLSSGSLMPRPIYRLNT